MTMPVDLSAYDTDSLLGDLKKLKRALEEFRLDYRKFNDKLLVNDTESLECVNYDDLKKVAAENLEIEFEDFCYGLHSVIEDIEKELDARNIQ